MNGMTILETVQATKYVINSPLIVGLIIFCIVSFIAISLIGDLWEKYKWFACVLTIILSIIPIILLCIADYEEVPLGYEYTIAYVDTNVVKEEQLKENYDILDSNKKMYIVTNKHCDSSEWEYEEIDTSEKIYILREKGTNEKEILLENTIHNKHIHKWNVLEIEKDNPYNNCTTYTLLCLDCKQEKLFVRENTEKELVDLSN